MPRLSLLLVLAAFGMLSSTRFVTSLQAGELGSDVQSVQLTLRNGSSLVGDLESLTDAEIVLATPYGKLTIQRAEVSAIVFLDRPTSTVEKTTPTGEIDADSVRARSRAWIGATVGYSAYSMNDINAEIRAIDALTSSGFKTIDGGLSVGAEIGVEIDSGVAVVGRYDRLLAGSKISDYSGSLEYALPANLVSVGIAVLLSSSSVAPGIQGGVGHLSIDGEASLSIQGLGAVSGPISGSGKCVYGAIFFDLATGDGISFAPTVGYRHIDVNGVKVDGEPIDSSVNYSGLFLGLSIKIGSVPARSASNNATRG